MGRSRSPLRFQARFSRLAEDCDGRGLYALLGESEQRGITAKSSSSPAEDVAAELIRAEHGGACEEALEARCSALKLWIARYMAQQKNQGGWMLLPLLRLASRPRRLAARLDRAGNTDKHQKKLVEVLREHFQKLHRDKRRREGALAVCCELMHIYCRLEQVSQCSPILKKLSHGQGGESLDLEALPKSLSVTLSFLWGRHCVLEGNVAEAEERLSWALAHCPLEASANRRRILAYLVPCRLRFGRVPTVAALSRHSLVYLLGLIKATVDGDVQLFNIELARREAQLIQMGTYLVVEKLKLLAYRNLCRQVHTVTMRSLEASGKAETRHKQDLGLYEHAFKWQDGCDADETLCLLAHLIHLGAIRGFLSDEHRKIVFSKENPFPDASKWCPNA